MGLIPTQENEIFNILISPLYYRGKVQRRIPLLNTQFFKKSTENRQRSVLTLVLTYPAECSIQREPNKKLN